jgi:tRNA threonylcarbamoyladenosine biosynthesis protein TsaE
MDQLVRTTHSPEETEALGAALAELLRPGVVVALEGGLGSGKTCFVRGLARVLAPEAAVHSPTFTLVNEYGPGPALIHADFYRLESPAEVADLGYAELFGGTAVCAIEWAERAGPLLPEKRLTASFAHKGPEAREVTFIDRGVLPDKGLEHIERAVS